MRVCLLTHYYAPELGAPQARLRALAAGLVATGHEVTVHTGFPHYPEGRVLAPYRPGLLHRETDGGVRIVRSVVAPLPNRGTLPRLADHTVFAAGAVATAPATGAQDVVVAESPPLFLGAAGIAYAAVKRARLVVNVADLWPASVVAVGALRPGRLVSAAERLEALVYRRADRVTTPTEGLARALEQHPDARGRVRRVRPVIDVARAATGPVRPADGPLRVVYIGTIGLAQRLETLVDAAALAGPDVVDVQVAGAGAELERLRSLTAARGIRNVAWLGPVPGGVVRDLYERAEVVTVLLANAPLFLDALPTKLVEAMAAGRPVALSAAGEAARHVDRSGCGVVTPPEDAPALADAFRDLRARRGDLGALGGRGREYAQRALAPDSAIADWVELLEEVVAQPASARRNPRAT